MFIFCLYFFLLQVFYTNFYKLFLNVELVLLEIKFFKSKKSKVWYESACFIYEIRGPPLMTSHKSRFLDPPALLLCNLFYIGLHSVTIVLAWRHLWAAHPPLVFNAVSNPSNGFYIHPPTHPGTCFLMQFPTLPFPL